MRAISWLEIKGKASRRGWRFRCYCTLWKPSIGKLIRCRINLPIKRDLWKKSHVAKRHTLLSNVYPFLGLNLYFILLCILFIYFSLLPLTIFSFLPLHHLPTTAFLFFRFLLLFALPPSFSDSECFFFSSIHLLHPLFSLPLVLPVSQVTQAGSERKREREKKR